MSTKILLKYINQKNVKGKSLLELGAGSGLISLEMSRRGARVTASDISKNAIENIKSNALKNKVLMEVLESDLFDRVGERQFDLIVINPPYL